MKAAVYGLDGNRKGEVQLASVFSKAIRPDIIRRAVVAEHSLERQPYGTDTLAGKRTSAHYHGLRHYRYTMMNKEMARLPRIHGRIGYLSLTARFVPQATKGRMAHPPKTGKVWAEKINRKEWLNALYSSIAASADMQSVLSRNHAIDPKTALPLVVDDAMQGLKKSSEVRKALASIGLEKELERVRETRQRAGRGKSRGRRTIERKGPLIIVAEDNGIIKAASNIPGVGAVALGGLDVGMLAPGTHPGRLAVWTKSAMELLEKTAKQPQAF